MVKCRDNNIGWFIWDKERNNFTGNLRAEVDTIETNGTNVTVSSTGFTIPNGTFGVSAPNNTFIYIAIGENVEAGQIIPTGTLSADANSSDPSMTLKDVTGTWADGMKVRGKTELTTKAPGTDVEFTSSAPVASTGTVTSWGKANWTVAEDAALSTNPQTTDIQLVPGMINKVPANTFTLAGDTEYYVGVTYNVTDPTGVTAVASSTNRFKVDDGIPDSDLSLGWTTVELNDSTITMVDGNNKPPSDARLQTLNIVPYQDGDYRYFLTAHIQGTGGASYTGQSIDGTKWDMRQLTNSNITGFNIISNNNLLDSASVPFIDPETGFIVVGIGRGYHASSGNYSIGLYSNDKGATWTAISLTSGANIGTNLGNSNVRFFEYNGKIRVMGENGLGEFSSRTSLDSAGYTLLRTTAWQATSSSYITNWCQTDDVIITPYYKVSSGGSYETFAQSTDGGETWTKVVLSASTWGSNSNGQSVILVPKFLNDKDHFVFLVSDSNRVLIYAAEADAPTYSTSVSCYNSGTSLTGNQLGCNPVTNAVMCSGYSGSPQIADPVVKLGPSDFDDWTRLSSPGDRVSKVCYNFAGECIIYGSENYLYVTPNDGQGGFRFYDENANEAVSAATLQSRYGVDPMTTNLEAQGIYELTEQPTYFVAGYVKEGNKYAPIEDFSRRYRTAKNNLDDFKSDLESRISALES